MSRKYQIGGDTDFFNSLIDAYQGQQQQQDEPIYAELGPSEDNTSSFNDEDYQALQDKYDELQSNFNDLNTRVNALNGQNFQDDSFLNFLFSDSDNKTPIDFAADIRTRGLRGLNPALEEENKNIFGNYNVTNLGAWGDQAHQMRQSDHNTGDAQDYGVSDPETANNVIAELQKNPKTKYIIYDKKIWNPSISNDWRPYSGSNPHTDHVHASFNRQYGGVDGNLTLRGPITQEGMNNPYVAQFGEINMELPQQFNVIRGLDNGTPVRVQDQLGNSAVLHGKHHKKYFFGNVNEKLV